MKKIVVCSKNKAKNKAVDNVIKEFIKEYEIISLETESNVSETPIGDDEGILGCKNRILNAKSQIDDADLYIAMEGIITKANDEYFLCGWTVIYDKGADSYLYGCSSKICISKDIIGEFNPNIRLSSVVAKYMGSSDEEVSTIGTNGILTHGSYTREDEFTDSIICAISTKYKKLD